MHDDLLISMRSSLSAVFHNSSFSLPQLGFYLIRDSTVSLASESSMKFPGAQSHTSTKILRYVELGQQHSVSHLCINPKSWNRGPICCSKCNHWPLSEPHCTVQDLFQRMGELSRYDRKGSEHLVTSMCTKNLRKGPLWTNAIMVLHGLPPDTEHNSNPHYISFDTTKVDMNRSSECLVQVSRRRLQLTISLPQLILTTVEAVV